MATATITSKGQVTIPSAIRNDLHLVPGDRIEFVKVEDGRYEVIAATNDIVNLKGLVKAQRAVTVEDMNAAIRSRAGHS